MVVASAICWDLPAYNIAETEIPRKIENFKAVKLKVHKNSS
jgi:hypothetical protein